MKNLDELVKMALEKASRTLVKPGSGTLAFLFGLISLGAPFLFGRGSIPLVGFLLIVTGSLHVFYSFRRISELEQRSEASRGKLTILAGLLVFYAPAMVSTAAIVLVALLLAFLAAQTIVSEIRNWRKGLFNRSRLIEPLLSIGLAVTFLLARDLSARILIGFAAAYWQFSAGWAIWSVPSRDLTERFPKCQLPEVYPSRSHPVRPQCTRRDTLTPSQLLHRSHGPLPACPPPGGYIDPF